MSRTRITRFQGGLPRPINTKKVLVDDATKRAAPEPTSEELASKKPKTKPYTETLEAAEATLQELKTNLSTIKSQYEASDAKQAEEYRKELVDRDGQIEKLKKELGASKCQVHLAVTLREEAERMRGEAERLELEAETAEQEAKEEHRLSEDAHNKRVTAMAKTIADSKGKLISIETRNKELHRKISEDRELLSSRIDVIVAARRVQDVTKGMPLEVMGSLGESIQATNRALTTLSKAEHGNK